MIGRSGGNIGHCFHVTPKTILNAQYSMHNLKLAASYGNPHIPFHTALSPIRMSSTPATRLTIESFSRFIDARKRWARLERKMNQRNEPATIPAISNEREKKSSLATPRAAITAPYEKRTRGLVVATTRAEK